MSKPYQCLLIGLVFMGAVGLALPPDWSVGQSPPAGVTLRAMRYTELGEFIRQQHGKVVVVDFWGDFCLPCKKAFTHLVSLHRKYAQAGLVAISVSLDPPEASEKVLRFLREQGADCVNFRLDEPVDVWQAKLKLDGPPCVYVFDRTGALNVRWVESDALNGEQIEQRVQELLKTPR